MAGRLSIVSVPEETWQGHCLGPEEEFGDLLKLVAWKSLAGRPRVGRPASHLAFPAPTSARAPPYFPYKRPHSLHGENHTRVQVISFQVLTLPYIVEYVAGQGPEGSKGFPTCWESS
jgi:hypothetical protein